MTDPEIFFRKLVVAWMHSKINRMTIRAYEALTQIKEDIELARMPFDSVSPVFNPVEIRLITNIVDECIKEFDGL